MMVNTYFGKTMYVCKGVWIVCMDSLVISLVIIVQMVVLLVLVQLYHSVMHVLHLMEPFIIRIENHLLVG